MRKRPGSLTQPQRDFIRVYTYSHDARLSAKLSGLGLAERPPATGPYVYLLLSDDRARVLYVGKGRGDRMFHHVAEARNGRNLSTRKFTALRGLLQQGRVPVPVVFAACATDRDALRLERVVITALRTVGLLNAMPGASAPHDKAAAEVRAIIDRIKPFDVWAAEVRPTPEMIALYNQITGEFRAVADQMAAGIFADSFRITTDKHGHVKKSLSYKGSQIDPEAFRRYHESR